MRYVYQHTQSVHFSNNHLQMYEMDMTPVRTLKGLHYEVLYALQTVEHLFT